MNNLTQTIITSPHPGTKYRPAFTLEQLAHIAHLTTTYEDDHPTSQAVKRIVVPLIAKVEVGAINPAYKLSETHTRKQAEASNHAKYTAGLMTPEEEADYESNVLGL